MIGIDTNILLRLFVRDDIVQLRRAEACFADAAKQGAVYINPIVLSEFAWTLASGYKLPRKEVAEHLESILTASDIEIMHRPAAEIALKAYRTGPADYADYYLSEINAANGCSKTFTFDKAALHHPRFAPVP
jgi:predicted nucleic-acid-binding protein